jgi:hypothetical protein
MSSVCHLVIISSMYILNSVGETGQPWCTLLNSASFDSLELNLINSLFCMYTSTIAFKCLWHISRF